MPLYKRIAGLRSTLKKHAQFVSFYWFPLAGSCRKMADGSDKCGDSEHVSDSSTSSETSSFPPRSAAGIQSELNRNGISGV